MRARDEEEEPGVSPLFAVAEHTHNIPNSFLIAFAADVVNFSSAPT